MAVAKPYRIAILIGYFIIISVLFCLPGSAFPKSGWLQDVAFDKWVHIGIFSVLVFLLNWAYNSTKSTTIIFILLGVFLYGALVEVVQDQWITNRSFDIGDWIADVVGGFIGLWAWLRYIKK